MNYINDKRAQEIASHWHGGQWSAYYQFASSGIYTIENCLRYLQETETNLHPEYNLHPGELTQRDERELNSLKKYFIRKGAEHGIKFELVPHEVYGYLIPYLAEDTPEEITNQVTQLQYMK